MAHNHTPPPSARRFGALLLAAAAATMIGACTAKAPISERIGAAVRQGQLADLAKLSEFAWDSGYVFSPFTTRERICKALAEQWPDCAAAVGPLVDEGTYLLVFVNQGRVVHHEAHARANGDFCSTSCMLELAPSSARFRAVAEGKLADGGTHYALYRAGP